MIDSNWMFQKSSDSRHGMPALVNFGYCYRRLWVVSSHSRLTVNDHCESAALAHFRGWQERCGSGFTREAGTEKRLQIPYEHSGFDARPVTLGPYLRIHIPRDYGGMQCHKSHRFLRLKMFG